MGNLFPLLVSFQAVYRESYFQTLNGNHVDVATENFCQVRDTQELGLKGAPLTSFPTLESYDSQEMAGRKL